MADSIVADEGEVLDDGLVEDTPDGDNLLLDFLRADAAAFRAQAAAVGGRLAHDPDLGLYLADTSSPSVFGNVAHLYRPVTDPGRARAVAERLTAFYGDAPGGAALVFSVVPTPDLSPYGLQPVGHPPLMVREPGLAPPPLPPGLSVEVVADLPALEAFESAFVQGYPVPECADAPPGSLFGPGMLDEPRWRLLAGVIDGAVVGTSAAFVGGPVTDIVMVSTRAEFRSRGIGAALTAAAADQTPQVPSVLVASDDGAPVYRRLGYRTLLRVTAWVVPRD